MRANGGQTRTGNRINTTSTSQGVAAILTTDEHHLRDLCEAPMLAVGVLHAKLMLDQMPG